jgi:sulfur carrier protein ThiS
MRITVKLYAGLGEYLPRGARDHAATLEVEPGATPHVVLRQCGVPPERAHLVLLNGIYLGRPERETQRLRDGDVIAAWPPVAGG